MIGFQYYNVNPMGIEESDCVCRAITGALDLDYWKVEKKLFLIAELFECPYNCVCCYHHLLEKVYGLKKQYAQGRTVAEIGEDYPNKTIIIRTVGHLTHIRNNKIFDLFDCRDSVADVFWIVK